MTIWFEVSIMSNWFEPGSGHAWCESSYKYQILPFVAEFANSLTAFAIIILPLVNVIMLRRYIREINSWIILPHLLVSVNGLFSSYYHAHLTFFGQIIDQLSLVWCILACLFAYFPTMKWISVQLKADVILIRLGLIVVNLIVSALCFVKPSMNDYVLMCFSIPIIVVIYIESNNSEFAETTSYAWRIYTLWLLAAICWCADRFLCEIWLTLGIPYLHAVFHILSSFSAYYIFIMFSLLDIHRREHEHKYVAMVNYFPFEDKNSWLNFPYISLKETGILAK